MCFCGQPTINGQPGYRWQPSDKPGVHPVNPPELDEHDTLVYDEPGRCGRGLDAHCHHFRVVKSFSFHYLLVRHGGGDERLRLSDNTKTLMNTLAAMDTTGHYWLLHAIYSTANHAVQEAAEKESQRWTRAAAAKRIKTRRVRGTDSVKVWIEPAKKLTS